MEPCLSLKQKAIRELVSKRVLIAILGFVLILVLAIINRNALVANPATVGTPPIPGDYLGVGLIVILTGFFGVAGIEHYGGKLKNLGK